MKSFANETAELECGSFPFVSDSKRIAGVFNFQVAQIVVLAECLIQGIL